MRKVVLDIETQNTFAEVGNDLMALELALVVAYDYGTNQYYSYQQAELPRLWKLLEHTDLIIGYNSDYFDIPLLNKYYFGDLRKFRSLDLLAEIKRMFGRRVSLNAVAQGTLNAAKSGDGLQSITWWRQGLIDKVRQYCEQDVRLTKEVYEYALKNRHIKVKNGLDAVTIPLDTSAWEEKVPVSVNFTLPF